MKMNKNLEAIHKYLLNKNVNKETIQYFDTHSVYLAIEIADYAHRDQKRANGEGYFNHPYRCLQAYRELVGIKEDDPFCIDSDLMHQFGIPFEGVQEVCLLHDVLEDTEFSIDDIRYMYIECGFGQFFDSYIKDALLCIAHDKNVNYSSYIEKCLSNPISALVKMMDLQDNIYVLDLTEFNEENYFRSQRYLFWLYHINSKYHFIENVEKYKKAFKKLS